MLGPQDVGHRVVVRRIVGVRANRPIFSDALGDLIDIDSAGLTVATAKGPLRIPHDRITAAKRIPPRRLPAAAAVIALERAASRAWPAPEQDRLGDWELRYAAGWTGRANSALPIGDPGVPLDTAFEAVRAWYRERAAPALINVPLPLARPIDRALDELGATRSPRTLVQTAALDTLTPTDEPINGTAVRLDGQPSPGWLALVAGRKGALPAAGYAVLTGPREVRFASITDGDDLLAIGRGALVDGFLQVALVEVAEPARRQGLAQRVVRALAGWAAPAGGHTAFLQVVDDNASALALYQRLGFSTHHSYFTRQLS